MPTYLDSLEKQIKQAENDLRKYQKQEHDARAALVDMRQKGYIHHFLKQQEILNNNILPNKEQAARRLAELKAQRQRYFEAIEQRRRLQEQERQAKKRMHKTAGDLIPAMIYPVNQEGLQKMQPFATIKDQLKPIYFQFNPKDYTIQKKAKYKGKGLNKHKNYNLEFDAEIQPRQLTLNSVWFDTSETGEDVRTLTDQLLNYVELQATAGSDFRTSYAMTQPPFVAFEWGTFRFLAVIQSVSLDFVYFKPDGTPLRAKASITFKEFKHRRLYARQNPSSGGGPKTRMWEVSASDRLDTIAAAVYGDASLWRLIAEHNNLDNWQLQPGQTLQIPPAWRV